MAVPHKDEKLPFAPMPTLEPETVALLIDGPRVSGSASQLLLLIAKLPTAESQLASQLHLTGQEQPSRMLRITVVESSATAVKLRVEGRIAGPWVDELRTTCNAHSAQEPLQLCLELEDVSFADAAGVVCLKELREQGVGFSRVSPFLTELFKSDSSPEGC